MADSFHFVILRTLFHREIEYNRQQVMELSTWCFVVIYIRYQSLVDSLQWNVESTLELDSEGASIPISPNSPRSQLIYLVGMGYEGQIGFKFTFVHKGILVIAQEYVKEVSELS